MICEARVWRVVQRRRGCMARAAKRRSVVQRVMASERKAQGPERKSCGY